jgi:hypothetical protein
MTEMPFTFAHAGFLLLALTGPPLVLLWFRRQPSIRHPRVSLHKNIRRRSLIALLPALTFCLAITAMAGALAQPMESVSTPASVIQSRDIMFAVDISTNMNEADSSTYSYSTPTIPGGTSPKEGCGTLSQWGQRKLDAMAFAVCDISQQLSGNRFAVEEFDGGAYMTLPFVTDSGIVERKSRDLNTFIGDGNTNFDGPNSAMQEGPGQLQVAFDFIKKSSVAKSKVLIIITDGDASIDPTRAAQLTTYAKSLGVKLVLMGAGADSAYDDPSSNDINTFTLNLASSGDAYVKGSPNDNGAYNAGSVSNINQTVKWIKGLPASRIPLEQQQSQRNIYQEFLLAAILLWILFLGANAVLGRTQ